MRLSGPQYQQLQKVLLDAFPTPARLTQMVRFQLDRNLNTIAMGDDLSEIVFKLIQAAEAEGWTAQLLLGARASNPGSPAVLAFSQQFGLAVASPPRPELERLIRETNAFLDVDRWRTRLGEIEGRVCRVETPFSLGTGFLLGPDVVMTNYHVMQTIIEQAPARAAEVVVRFDYKQLADGTTIHPGTKYQLADEWLIDRSPPSSTDNEPEPKSGLPQRDELDYALLRTAGAPGAETVGGKTEPNAPARGWMEVPAEAYEFLPSSPLFIVQHPQGKPVKLALDTDGVIGLNANQTRVTYRTNTEAGSSGSPCFDGNWNLVALHHSGDPNFDPAHKPVYNEGVPFSTIRSLLEQRGKAGALGEQEL